jgi:hypothetical protein
VNLLRVAAGPAGEAKNPLAGQLSGDLAAQHVRQLRHLRVQAAPDEHIHEVHARRADVERRFVRLLDLVQL